MAKNNPQPEKTDKQESNTDEQLKVSTEPTGSTEDASTSEEQIENENSGAVDLLKELTEPTGSTDNTSASENKSASEESETEALANQLMLQHKVSSIWKSADGFWFTQKGSAKNHDPEAICFTLKSEA